MICWVFRLLNETFKIIDSAVRQQIERLRRDVSPELLRAARVVLKKIQRAQTCLQDPLARASYDLALTGENSSSTTASIWNELDATTIEASAQSKSIRVAHAPNPRVANGPLLRAPSRQRKSTGHTKALRWRRAIAYSFAGLTLALVAIFAGYAIWPRPEAGETQSLQDLSERLANANESSRSKSELISPLKPTPPKSDSLTEQSTESQTSEPSAVQHSNSNGLTNFQIHNSKNVRPETDKNNDLEDTKANELKTPTSGGTPVPGALVTNGIASLSVAIELPAQRTTDSALPSGATSADGIVELGPVPSQGLKITLDQPQVMSVQGISFDITSDATRATGSAWEVRLRSVAQQDGDKEKSSLDDLARGLDEVVARIYVEDGQLKFIWTNSKYSQLAEQLRNCVLCIANGEQTHRMQLRPFQKIAPVVLDFEPSIVSFNVEGESFPASEAVFLSVQPSPALMKSISMEPESGTVPVNKIVTLRVSGEEQSQIEILVTIKKTASGLFVTIAPAIGLVRDGSHSRQNASMPA